MIKVESEILKNLDLKQSLPQQVVDIANKKRRNLFTWRGQFSPQLIEALIQNYAKKGDVLFDPFTGSGTLLLEAASLDLDIYGTELNPAAFGLASIYKLIQVPPKDRETSLEIIEDLVNDYIPLQDLFNQSEGKALSNLKEELVNAHNKHKSSSTGIIIKALIIGLDFEQKKLDYKKLQTAWNTLKTKVQNLPYSSSLIELFLADARKTSIEKSTIDLVITSPPYINVFNYHQNYRKSVEAIGYNVLDVAKSEIGSNRKFRSNRFLTVIQYALDIFLVFQELKRICKKDAKVIFIVGRESSVRKTPFFNAKILTEVANTLGFELKGEQPRVFTNKFGQNIYEEILRFSINHNTKEKSIEKAKTIAIKHLKNALKFAPKESIEDLKSAIIKADKVDCSKIYIPIK